MDELPGELDWQADEHLRRIASFILREESLVDDVLQEAWLRSFRGGPPDSVTDRSRRASLVRHLSLNLRRAELRRARRERSASKPEPLESTSEIVARRSVLSALAEAIDQLEEPLQAPVRLHYLAGHEVKQVAATLGRPIPTVRDQLRRGIDRLRERLRGRFGDSRAWGLALVAAFDWDERDVLGSLRSSGWSTSAKWFTGGALTCITVVAMTLRPSSSTQAEHPVLESSASLPAVDSASVLSAAAASAQARSSVDLPETATQPPMTVSSDGSQEPSLLLRVVDSVGAPVAGAKALFVRGRDHAFHAVADDLAHCITNSEGCASIRPSRAWIDSSQDYGEAYSIRVQAQGLAHSDVYSIVLAEMTKQEVRIELDQGEVVLDGRVLDAQGVALDRGSVALVQSEMASKQRSDGVIRTRWVRSTQSVGTDGRFRFDGVRPGTYELFVQHPERGMDRVRVDLVRPGLYVRELTLDRGAVIHGRVVDADGNALADASVWFLYQSRVIRRADSPFPSVRSADDGSFEIQCLAGVPTIVRSAWGGPGEIIAEQSLIPTQGRNAPIELVLRPQERLDVVVVDASGAPVSDVEVTVMTGRKRNDLLTREGVTDVEGRVSLPLGLDKRDGMALLLRRIAAPNGLPQKAVGVLPSLRSVRVVFEPAEPAAIAGDLNAARWIPPSDFSLYMEQFDAAAAVRFAVPSQAGPFLIEGIPPAKYDVRLLGGESFGIKLGLLELTEGELRDLGAIDLPVPGSVVFDWNGHRPGSEHPVDLASIRRLTVQRETWRLWNGETLRDTPLELLPGDYSLRVEYTDGSRRDWPFHVDSRQETVVTVDL